VTQVSDFFNVRKVSVRRSMVLLAGGALIGLLVAGYGLFTAKGTRSRGVPPEAIALVNQRPILRSDFMTQAQTQYTLPFSQTTSEQRRKVLQDMIYEELMVQRGLEIDLPSYDPDVRAALVSGVELEVTAGVVAQQPTPEELRSYYEQHKARYSADGVMRLRDLVVKPEPANPGAAHAKALAAIAALRRGQPLDAAIKNFSLADSGRFMDAGHVDTGDILQFSVHAKVDDSTYNAILALKDGEVSEPIDAADGVHLIVMIHHRIPVAQTFEQASTRVWSDLRTEALAKVNSANIAYLRSRADISVATEYSK
jgi:parvulin-like peptidyl-prolyl isomerase